MNFIGADEEVLFDQGYKNQSKLDNFQHAFQRVVLNGLTVSVVKVKFEVLRSVKIKPWSAPYFLTYKFRVFAL